MSTPDEAAAPLDGGRQTLLLVVVPLCGAAVLILELAAGRLLAPWFGLSLPVWTNVLAVVLGALAAGYALGGRLAAGGASLRTMGALLVAGGVLSSAAAFIGPRLGPALLPEGANLEGLSGVLARGSLLATLVLFGPPMVLLGTVGPLAVHLLAPGRDAGRAAGWVLALSTLGSILGTFLTTYVLLPVAGTRATVGGTGAALAAMGLLLWRRGPGGGGGRLPPPRASSPPSEWAPPPPRGSSVPRVPAGDASSPRTTAPTSSCRSARSWTPAPTARPCRPGSST